MKLAKFQFRFHNEASGLVRGTLVKKRVEDPESALKEAKKSPHEFAAMNREKYTFKSVDLVGAEEIEESERSEEVVAPVFTGI